MNIIIENIKGFLKEHNIKEVSPEEIAKKVSSYTVEWNREININTKLTLLRLTLPVVMREEIFLGSILLNIFIVKALERVLKEKHISYSIIAEDLSNYFILAINISPIDEIIELLKNKLISDLPDLYFSNENLDAGYFGNLKTMLEFYKSNVEPFPIFILPEELASQLEEKVNINLSNLLASDEWINNFNIIMANMAFFYSKAGDDMQSPSTFLANLVNNYKIIEAQELAEAFNLKSSDIKKDIIKKSFEIKKDKKTGAVIETKFYKEKLRNLLKKLIKVLSDKAKEQPNEWLCHYIRKGKENKFLQLSCTNLANKILEGIQIGSNLISDEKFMSNSNRFCRLCGHKQALLLDRSILLGQAVNRFYNHLIDQSEREIICSRCALATYLIVKMLGSYTIGQPQVPKKYNLFFHYGNHNDEEIKLLNKKLDQLFVMAKNFDKIEEIKKSLADNTDIANAIPSDIEDPDFLINLLNQHNIESLPALETLAGTVDIDSPLKSRILPLISGTNRLLLIILPQFRYSGKEGPDFIQKRFSKSKLHLTAILGLLKEICGCDGSYYYRSIPSLMENNKLIHTFYINSKPFQISEVLNQYNIISKYVSKLLYGRYGKNIVEKFILSEKIIENPLETFSHILKKTPIRGGDKLDDKNFKFKRISNVFISGQGVIDSLEYIIMFKELLKLEGATLSKQINTEKINEFCNYLFSTLNSLDLLPRYLSAKPTEYEKYPRLLFGLLRRYGSVEAGFKEWETKILRDVDENKKEKYYYKIKELFNWMKEYSELFEDNNETINHLSKSLYGRLYNYLYPHRLLVGEYIRTYKGKAEGYAALDDIDNNFARAVECTITKLSNDNVFTDIEINTLKSEVISYIKDRNNYYKKVLSNKED